MTSLAQAIKSWETKNQSKSEDAAEIKLVCQIPPISKLDNSLTNLKKCEILSLSTNTIDRIPSLSGMVCLRILSLGRNNIKKIEKVEDVAGSLEQLWLSYNSIASLDGLSSLTMLTTFYCSNNQIKSFSELEKIEEYSLLCSLRDFVIDANTTSFHDAIMQSTLTSLRDVLFIGNPMYDEVSSRRDARIEILKYLPNVSKIDGEMVKPAERDEAKKKAIGI